MGAVALVVVGLVGIPATHRYLLARKVEKRIAAMAQRGFPVTLQELDQSRPAIAPGLDAALVVERAYARRAFFSGVPGSIQVNLPSNRGKYPNPAQPIPAPGCEAMTRFLSSNEMTLAILHEPESLSRGGYATDWLRPGGKAQTQTEGLRLIEQLLQYELILRAEEHDWKRALQALHRLFELSQSLSREPLGIHHYSRASCFRQGVIGLEWLVSRTALPDEELEKLQKRVLEAGTPMDWNSLVAGFRCLAVDFYRSPPNPWGPAGFGAARPIERILYETQAQIHYLVGTNERGLIALLDSLDEFDRLKALPSHQRLANAEQLAGSAGNPGQQSIFAPLRGLSAKFFFEQFVQPGVELEALARATAAGLAVERYRLRNAGRLPESLEQLRPEFLDKVPADPYDGLPLRYSRSDMGYRVYSIGPDRSDEGGAGIIAHQNASHRSGPRDIGFAVER
jgi:hypothetical protein